MSKMLKDLPYCTYSWVRGTCVSAECTTSECEVVNQNIWIKIWASGDDAINFSPIENISSFKKLCRKCANEARKQHNVGRQKMWDKLPIYFGWSSWDDVLK